jgi:hypothetical protein
VSKTTTADLALDITETSTQLFQWSRGDRARLERVQGRMGGEVWKQGGQTIFEMLFCFVLLALKWDQRNRIASGGACEVMGGLVLR